MRVATAFFKICSAPAQSENQSFLELINYTVILCKEILVHQVRHHEADSQATPGGPDVFSKQAQTSTAFQSFTEVGVGERVPVQGLIYMANNILCTPYYTTFLANMHVRYGHSRYILIMFASYAALESQVTKALSA